MYVHIFTLFQYYILNEYGIAKKTYKNPTKTLARTFLFVYIFCMKTIQQYKVAQWLGVAPGTLANVFCGNRGVSKEMAQGLEKISGVSFSDWMLLSGKDLKKKVFIAYTFHKQQSTGKE